MDQGVRLANEAGESLGAITMSAMKSGEHSREIVSAVQEQSRSHEAVRRGTHQMSEVARQMHATTEEQARGVLRIGASAEGVREASESIHTLVESQTAACGTSADLLGQLSAQTAISEESVSKMEEAIRNLVADSQRFRADVARFRL